jgi:hypothetical protein
MTLKTMMRDMGRAEVELDHVRGQRAILAAQVAALGLGVLRARLAQEDARRAAFTRIIPDSELRPLAESASRVCTDVEMRPIFVEAVMEAFRRIRRERALSFAWSEAHTALEKAEQAAADLLREDRPLEKDERRLRARLAFLVNETERVILHAQAQTVAGTDQPEGRDGPSVQPQAPSQERQAPQSGEPGGHHAVAEAVQSADAAGH